MTRRPLAVEYLGHIAGVPDRCVPYSGDYVFFTQLLNDPSRIWARPVPATSPSELVPYRVVVQTTETLQIPARGSECSAYVHRGMEVHVGFVASLATIYNPGRGSEIPSKSHSHNMILSWLTYAGLVVIYMSPEGVLDYKDVPLP